MLSLMKCLSSNEYYGNVMVHNKQKMLWMEHALSYISINASRSYYWFVCNIPKHYCLICKWNIHFVETFSEMKFFSSCVEQTQRTISWINIYIITKKWYIFFETIETLLKVYAKLAIYIPKLSTWFHHVNLESTILQEI